jgi:hypothetical protein
MAIELSEGDPVVFLLVYGQPYPATVVATDEGDPPILTLEADGRTFANIPYNAAGQVPNTWCLYTDPGRPGTLDDPAHVVSPAVSLSQADADARYLTQAQADARYAAIDHEHA